MSQDLTLPGDIPGLLRRCSPVIKSRGKGAAFRRRGVLLPSKVEAPRVWVLWEQGLTSETTEPVDACGLHLDLTDATGLLHALWWAAKEAGYTGLVERLAWVRVDDGWVACSMDWGEPAGVGEPALVWGWGCSFGGDGWPIDGLDDVDRSSPAANAEALRLVCLHMAGRA